MTLRRVAEHHLVMSEIEDNMPACPRPEKQKKTHRGGGGIKTTPADRWFSLCVRERADWTCERCGKHYEPEYNLDTGLPKNQALDCSHFHGRGKWATRTDPDNCDAACYGCHRHFESQHEEYREWKIARIGQERFDILRENRDNYQRFKASKHGDADGTIEAHFKAEFERMRKLRAQGVTGRIEFVGWL